MKSKKQVLKQVLKRKQRVPGKMQLLNSGASIVNSIRHHDISIDIYDNNFALVIVDGRHTVLFVDELDDYEHSLYDGSKGYKVSKEDLFDINPIALIYLKAEDRLAIIN